MAAVCLLLLEDGSGFLEIEDGSGRLELEACLQPVVESPFGGWAEPWTVREQEVDLVVAVLLATRRRGRLTVG